MGLNKNQIVWLVVGFLVGISIYIIYTRDIDWSVLIGMGIGIALCILFEILPRLNSGKADDGLPKIDERGIHNLQKTGFITMFILLFVIPLFGMGVASVIGVKTITIPTIFLYLLGCMIVLSIVFFWIRKN